MKKHYIRSWISLKNGEVFLNGDSFFQNTEEIDLNHFLKSLYRHLKINYTKFFKMDALSKLAFLATEVLFLHHRPDKETALVLSNSASSLQTDLAFYDSMNGFPSPSLFVYTLPNILLGEISIRHSLNSENMFFIKESFDANLITGYTSALFEESNNPEALCGWIDLHNDEYDVFLCHIAQSGRYDFNEESLKKLYSTSHE
ncbi:3-oxoacyl-ACP synthase [Christiangramia fulva]|uniref:3-oxoacyl-ACP synthase n=1 Tax=Christiangramia fulva TaxID=2126553 RepID=UPI001873D5B6|nr:3-oxoacyl-ACP synthase [Christiangramia fulva]